MFQRREKISMSKAAVHVCGVHPPADRWRHCRRIAERTIRPEAWRRKVRCEARGGCGGGSEQLSIVLDWWSLTTNCVDLSKGLQQQQCVVELLRPNWVVACLVLRLRPVPAALPPSWEPWWPAMADDWPSDWAATGNKTIAIRRDK